MEPFSASFAAQKLSKILTHRAYVREPIILIFFFCFVFFFLLLILPYTYYPPPVSHFRDRNLRVKSSILSTLAWDDV
jgi:hypothetical protein